MPRGGVLTETRAVEMAGMGAVPLACLMLADHGPEAICVERPGASHDPCDILWRNRCRIAIDIKSPDGLAVVRDLAVGADALVKSFRPGVMERLGNGSAALLATDPGLINGRMTGWDQDGPLAKVSGHNNNYIAPARPSHTCGRAGQQPMNAVGDFGGGG